MGAGLIVSSAQAQKPIALTEPAAPLLPQRFGGWQQVNSATPSSGHSFATEDRAALAECGPKRTAAAVYARAGQNVQIEAMEFGDRTGATSAFTLLEKPGMKLVRLPGVADAVGVEPGSGGTVLLTQEASLIEANFGATASLKDVASLKPLLADLPKVAGNQGVAPLLPMLPPRDGLVEGSLRYALGPLSYSAEGGLLPAATLGWNADLEAVMAQYDDARGRETLTLLLYPTPTIAENYAKSISADVKGMEANGATAALHREGVLVMVASGTFSPAAAAQMMSSIHLKQMTFNQDVQPAFPVVAKQTFSLLTNIAILSGVLMAAAVFLGLFLGLGRATLRVMRGKPAAVEPEFLSLHLSPQNKPAEFPLSGRDPQEDRTP